MPSWQAVLRGLTYEGIPLWRHTRIIQWVLQVVSGILVVVLVVWFFANISGAIQDRDIPHGFGFLSREYQTSIGQHFLPYESSDTFRYAFIVATTNTIIVSIVGVILATALGIFIGVSRMSGNWLVSKAALVYIEFFRNVPLLVQLFFWFNIVLALPTIQEEYVIADVLHINNRGVSMPWPDPVSAGAAWMFPVVLVVAALAGVAVHRAMERRETLTGAASYPMVLGGGRSHTPGGNRLGCPQHSVWRRSFHHIRSEDTGSLPPTRGRVHCLGRFAGAASGACHVHVVLYCRNRPGRHPIGRPWAERSRPVPGTPLPEGSAPCDLSAGPEGYSPSDDKPVPEPHQEQQPCRGHWLLRPDQRSQDHDPDSACRVHFPF